MAKIHIENGIISSSADYGLYHGTSEIAKVEAGGLRVQGDVTAENLIVSSSVTYMTQSFSSGSTIFGDSSDDIHQMTGSYRLSKDTTGSGGERTTNHEMIIIKNDNSVTPYLGFGASINFQGRTYNNHNIRNLSTIKHQINDLSSVNSETGTHWGSSLSFITTNAGNSTTVSTKMEIQGSGNIVFPYANQKISGSATSTGSFGAGFFGGRLGIGTTSPGHRFEVEHSDDTVAQFKSTDNNGQIIVADDDTTAYFGANGSRAFMGTASGLAGTTNLVVDSSGQVGIGTTSPEQLLHLRSEAPFLAFTDSSNNSESGILYRNTSGTNVGFSLYDFGNNAFKIRTNNSLALTIDSAQDATFAGHIALAATKGIFFDGGSHTSIAESSGDNLRFQVGASNVLDITTTKISGSATSTGSFGQGYFDGRVGIGAVNPDISATAVDQLVVGYPGVGVASTGTNHTGIVIGTGNTHIGRISFLDTPSAYGGAIDYHHAAGAGGVDTLSFYTDGYTRRLVLEGNKISGSAASTGSFGHGYIDNKLGIGDTSPSEKLDVSGGHINIDTGYAYKIGTNRFLLYNGNTFLGDIDNAGGNVQIREDGSTKMTISGGNVGIGNTSPSQKLTVEGVISGSGTGYFGNIILGGTEQIAVNNGNLYYTGGNLGIGTTGPTALLHLEAGSDNATGGIRFTNDDTGGSTATDGTALFIEQNTTDFFIRNYENAGIRMRTNDTDALYISSGQKVGIGNTNPPEALTVTGDISASLDIHLGGRIRHAGELYINPTTNLRLLGNVMTFGSVGGTEYARFDSSGRLGIGTSVPSQKLEISAGNIMISGSGGAGVIFKGTGDGSNKNAIYFKNASNTEKFRIIHDPSANGTDDLQFKANANSVTVMTMLQNGRVGINTTAPDYKLDVAGNAGINEYLYHNGDTNTYLRFQADQTDLSAGGNVVSITSNGTTIADTKTLGTSTFISGITGDGFRIDDNGSDGTFLEIDNIFVRNTLRTHIFQKDVVKATNGILFISDSGVISGSSNSAGTVTFEDSKSATFSDNQILLFKDVPDQGAQAVVGVRFQINGSGTVGNGSNGVQSGFTRYNVDNVDGDLDDLNVGGTAARISGGTVAIDASSNHSPFIDVNASSGSAVVRMGKLSGITSPVFGSLGEEFGLWASGSVYLEGSINATSGGFIAGWSLNSNTIEKIDSNGGVKIDSSNKRIDFLSDASTTRLRVGQVDSNKFGMRGFNDGGTRVFEISEVRNEIAGWAITTGAISSSAGNVQIDSDNSRFLIQDSSGQQRVRMGKLNSSNQYGISGSDSAGKLLFKLGEAGNEIAGWGITETVISSSDGNVQIDAGNSRFLIKSGSGERVRMGLLNDSKQYGISGSDENGNLLFKLGDAGNEIAGWRIAQGKLDFDHPTGSIAIDASNKNIAIYTGSINADRPKVVMGNLPTTGDTRYGFAVFSGSGDADISDDDSYSVLITKDKARLAGWDLVPGRLRSGTVADINGNQAKIALGLNANQVHSTPQPSLFYVSASSNPTFFVGENFSYVDDVLTAAGWKISRGQISSSNGKAILSGSGVLSLGTGTHNYKQNNRTFIDGPNNRMSIGQNFFYESNTLNVGAWTLGSSGLQDGGGVVIGTTGANKFGIAIDDDDDAVNFWRRDRDDGRVEFQVGTTSQFIKYDSNASTAVQINTKAFFLGNNSTSFVSGSNNLLEISSSNFHLQRTGDVTVAGKVTANEGSIGGWSLSDSALSKSSVFITSSLNEAGLIITDGTDKILSVVSSSGLTDVNTLTGSKGSSPDAQFEDNEFELGSNGNLITAASRWSQETIRWDTDLSAGHASQPNWLKDTDNALIFPQCAELPSGTVINEASFGTIGYAAFFRDIPVTTGLVSVSSNLRGIDWKYYGEKSGITAYCEMQITGSDNATFASGTKTNLFSKRVQYTSTKPTFVRHEFSNKGNYASIRIKFNAVHDLSDTKAKSYTLGGWTVDGLKIVGINGNPGTGGSAARTKPLVELNQEGMFFFSSRDSFIKLDDSGLQMKGDIEATDVDVQGELSVTGSLTSNSELNIKGAVNFSTDVALALGHTNPESKIHVSESFFNGTSNNALYPDSLPIGQDVSWRKVGAASYSSLAPGYAGDGSDPFSIGSVFRAQFNPFLSNNADTGQFGFTAAYGTGHIHDSYGRTANHMMYGELITGDSKGYVGSIGSGHRMSGSIGIGKVWSYSSNKNMYGSDIVFAYGPNATDVGEMRQVGHRVILLNNTTIDNVDDINGAWYNQGFQVNRGGTINVDVDSSTGATTLGGFAAFAAYNNSDGTYGSTAGYGFWIAEFEKNYISGKLGINDATPSYDLDITGDIRTTGEGYFEGGVHVGGTTDPGDDNLVVDGNVTTVGTGSFKYVDIGGTSGASTHTLRIAQNASGTAIRIGGHNTSQKINILRIDTGDGVTDSANFGHSIVYRGDLSGNNNSLNFLADNQSGTQVEAQKIYQDGTVEFPQGITSVGSEGLAPTSTNVFQCATTAFNINAASEGSLGSVTLGTPTVENATYVAHTDNQSSVDLKVVGEYAISVDLIVDDSSVSDRHTFFAYIEHQNSSGTKQYDYPIGAMYIRGNVDGYDAGGIGGQIRLITNAVNDRIVVKVLVLDRQNTGTCNLDTSLSRVKIDKINYG